MTSKMAARVARVAGKQIIRLHSTGAVKLCQTNSLQLNLIRFGSTPRAISQFPHTSQNTRLNSRYNEAVEEEELEYDVADDQLDELRKEHRTVAKGSHASREGKKFSDFPLEPYLLKRLDALGYSEPFEIQATTLEHTLAGRDVIARALTGSGKTLAFSVPIVQKLVQRGERRQSNNSPKAIVISPTRELCMQIYRSIQELDSRVRCVPVYGGASINVQENQLRRGVDVICATPGRLNDHLERGTINLDQLEFLCLDEADELLTPGFKEQIQNVLETAPEGRQVMLFSATMPSHIKSLTRQYMNDAVTIDITANQRYKAPECVKHLCMKVAPRQQLFTVRSLLNEYKPERCIVFMETKRATTAATQVLRHKMGIRADGISSDLSQSKRENIMAAFRAGKIKVLVGTDVAARGLDIPEVDLVIQATPPRNGTDYYIHRSGRTGRGGREGISVLMHDGSRVDRQTIWEIEKLAKLEHVEPPNEAEMMEEVARHTLSEMQKKTNSKLTAKLLPIVEELNLTVADANQLIAAALTSSVTVPEAADTERRRPERMSGGGYKGRGFSTGGNRSWGRSDGDYSQDRQRSMRGYGNKRSSHNEQRNPGLWEEDDYADNNTHNNSHNNTHNNTRRQFEPNQTASKDWSKFY